MKCRSCDTVIDQSEADRAAHAVGPGYDTMCGVCAEHVARVVRRPGGQAVPPSPEPV